MMQQPSESIDNPQTSSVFRAWLVVMTTTLLFFYTFIQMNMLNSISSDLMHIFSLNARQLGTLSGAYFYGYFLLLFPAGLLLDRLSVRKIILIAMLLAAISMFTFSLSTHYYAAAISRFIAGACGAFSFLGSIRLASRWFPPKKMALVSGTVVAFAMLGGMVAQTPMELLSVLLGWRKAAIIFSVLGIIFFMLIALIVRDFPIGYQAAHAGDKDISVLGFRKSIRMVVFNRYNWFGGLYTTFMNLPIFLLGSLWGSMCLTQIDFLTKTQAATVDSMIFFGTLVGSPLVGWISDKLKLRVLPMVVGAIVSLVIILFVIYVLHLSFFTLIFLFFLLGLITSTQVLSYPAVTELNSTLVTSSAISIVSLLIMASAFICQPLFGWLMDLNWKHVFVQHAAVYSLQDFRTALWIMPIGFIASIVLALFIKETHCQRQVED